MGQVILSKCLVTTEIDWIPIVLEPQLCALAKQQGEAQEEMSKARGLRDRAINQNTDDSLRHSIFSKRSEYAIHQWAGKLARVTLPGDFHKYPDVGQVNARWIGDPTDGLMIQDNDQGDMPMVLTTSKDLEFKDQTIWLIGWGMTDLLRRHFCMINQFRENKNWGRMGSDFEAHEQFIYPRAMLNPMKTLSKEYVNTPYITK